MDGLIHACMGGWMDGLYTHTHMWVGGWVGGCRPIHMYVHCIYVCIEYVYI